MIRYENDCVDCGLPCLGDSCPHRNVPHYYCDECEEETDIYEFEDEQLCVDCIVKRLRKIGD